MMKISVIDFLILWLFFHPTLVVFAALKNVTVDDDGLDPTNGGRIEYSPDDGSFSLGQVCSDCLAKLNASLVYNGTWRDYTAIPNAEGKDAPHNITFHFTGEKSH